MRKAHALSAHRAALQILDLRAHAAEASHTKARAAELEAQDGAERAEQRQLSTIEAWRERLVEGGLDAQTFQSWQWALAQAAEGVQSALVIWREAKDHALATGQTLAAAKAQQQGLQKKLVLLSRQANRVQDDAGYARVEDQMLWRRLAP